MCTWNSCSQVWPEVMKNHEVQWIKEFSLKLPSSWTFVVECVLILPLAWEGVFVWTAWALWLANPPPFHRRTLRATPTANSNWPPSHRARWLPHSVARGSDHWQGEGLARDPPNRTRRSRSSSFEFPRPFAPRGSRDNPRTKARSTLSQTREGLAHRQRCWCQNASTERLEEEIIKTFEFMLKPEYHGVGLTWYSNILAITKAVVPAVQI